MKKIKSARTFAFLIAFLSLISPIASLTNDAAIIRNTGTILSILPFDDPDPIVVLPVYADSELGVFSTWVGDLEAGSSVMLLSVHPDGRSCFVEGRAIQGWDIQGWVACNRLIFHEPTPIVNPEE